MAYWAASFSYVGWGGARFLDLFPLPDNLHLGPVLVLTSWSLPRTGGKHSTLSRRVLGNPDPLLLHTPWHPQGPRPTLFPLIHYGFRSNSDPLSFFFKSGSMIWGMLGNLLSYFCPAFLHCPPGLHQALGQLLAPVHHTVLQDKESLHVIQHCDALVMVTVVRLREIHTQDCPQRLGE